MTNCIIAQSGGPTSVINSSVVGLYNANKELKAYNKVFAGLNGIEGILNGNIIDLTSYSDEEINKFRFTPSSGLGSCRYKMKDLDVILEFQLSSNVRLNNLTNLGNHPMKKYLASGVKCVQGTDGCGYHCQT